MTPALARLAFAAILLACLPRLAAAVTPEYLDAQRGLIADGYAAQARDALDYAVTQEPGNPELFFLLGMARRTSGDEAGAAAAFRTCADLAPDQPRPLLELGTSLGNLGRYDEAFDIFNQALAMADDRQARRNIRRVMSRLDYQRVFSLSISTRAQPDSNANVASGNQVVIIGGIPFVLNKPNKAHETFGLGVDAALRYAPYLTDAWRLVNDASFSGVNFFHTCCSDDTVGFASGPGWQSGAYRIVTQAYARRRYFDGVPYSEERGGRAEIGRMQDGLSLSSALEAGSTRLLGPHVPGTLGRIALGADQALDTDISLGLVLRLERDDYPIPSQRFTSGSVELHSVVTGPFDVPVRVWALALARQYDGQTLTSPGRRLDHLWGSGVVFDLDMINLWGMSPQIGVTWLSQASNDTLGRFNRLSGVLGLSRGF